MPNLAQDAGDVRQSSTQAKTIRTSLQVVMKLLIQGGDCAIRFRLDTAMIQMCTPRKMDAPKLSRKAEMLERRSASSCSRRARGQTLRMLLTVGVAFSNPRWLLDWQPTCKRDRMAIFSELRTVC